MVADGVSNWLEKVETSVWICPSAVCATPLVVAACAALACEAVFSATWSDRSSAAPAALPSPA